MKKKTIYVSSMVSLKFSEFEIRTSQIYCLIFLVRVVGFSIWRHGIPFLLADTDRVGSLFPLYGFFGQVLSSSAEN